MKYTNISSFSPYSGASTYSSSSIVVERASLPLFLPLGGGVLRPLCQEDLRRTHESVCVGTAFVIIAVVVVVIIIASLVGNYCALSKAILCHFYYLI